LNSNLNSFEFEFVHNNFVVELVEMLDSNLLPSSKENPCNKLSRTRKMEGFCLSHKEKVSEEKDSLGRKTNKKEGI